MSNIDCPRAKSDMTPCVARDGKIACADNGVCVGCGEHPADLLSDLVPKYVELLSPSNAAPASPATQAERESILSEVEQHVLSMYEKGPGRGSTAWAQSWGSGVLDVADAIKALRIAHTAAQAGKGA